MKYGSVSVDVGDVAAASNRRPEGLKQRLAVLSIISLGLAVMCLSVWGAEPWRKGEQGVLLQRGLIPRASKNAGIEEQLWFGPGITDQLNRYVRIGKGMSGRLEANLKRGLEEQSKMVHLDSFHQGEVGHASDEDDLWRDQGEFSVMQAEGCSTEIFAEL